MLFSVRLAALLLALLAAPAWAQEPVQSLRGTVRNAGGTPLSGADVFIGTRHAITDANGTFRVDSLRPGRYPVTLRLVGYLPLHASYTVTARASAPPEYVMVPAPHVLPEVSVRVRRGGIYGTVADSGLRPLAGVRVLVAGFGGGDALTDAKGAFRFPRASGGQYMIRFTIPGYAERRMLIELESGEGRELAVRLVHSTSVPFRGDEWALKDLSLRLSIGLERERLSATELVRYTSVSLCDVPRIFEQIGRNRDARFLFSLNGVITDSVFSYSRACAWHADEVELVEFGSDICGESSRTVSYLVGIWCTGRVRRSPRTVMGTGSRVSGQSSGMPYMIIWEKR